VLPVVRKLFDGVLGIVVIPRDTIIMDEREQLLLILEQPCPQRLGCFGVERLRGERLKEARGLLVMLCKVFFL